jgi:TPR repeat protein
MSEPGASGGRVRGLLASAAATAVIAIAPGAWAQASAAKSAPPAKAALTPELRAAMAKADDGDPGELVRLADAGGADAQYYAGRMYISGRGKVAPDPKRGCAYVERASAKRADAMYMAGACQQRGLAGPPDLAKAKMSYTRAIEMGDPNAKCALGELLIAEPGQTQRGLGLCKAAANAGDVEAQAKVGGLYLRGGPIKADHKEARRWYEMAAQQRHLDSMRILGQMYSTGDGGKRDVKKAISLWTAGDKAGDPLVAILMADQLFANVTGGMKPGPGTFAFRGGIPVSEIEVIEEWYRDALKRDPRPDVKKRAESAISVLASFKKAAKAGG